MGNLECKFIDWDEISGFQLSLSPKIRGAGAGMTRKGSIQYVPKSIKLIEARVDVTMDAISSNRPKPVLGHPFGRVH